MTSYFVNRLENEHNARITFSKEPRSDPWHVPPTLKTQEPGTRSDQGSEFWRLQFHLELVVQGIQGIHGAGRAAFFF